MEFEWQKSTQVFKILLSILADLIIRIIAIIFLLESFFPSAKADRFLLAFEWEQISSSLQDSSLYSSRFKKNAVVWTVSTRAVISKSSKPCTNHQVNVQRKPITIVTLKFDRFFNYRARSRYLFIFSYSFNVTLWFAGTANFTIL